MRGVAVSALVVVVVVVYAQPKLTEAKESHGSCSRGGSRAGSCVDGPGAGEDRRTRLTGHRKQTQEGKYDKSVESRKSASHGRENTGERREERVSKDKRRGRGKGEIKEAKSSRGKGRVNKQGGKKTKENKYGAKRTKENKRAKNKDKEHARKVQNGKNRGVEGKEERKTKEKETKKKLQEEKALKGETKKAKKNDKIKEESKIKGQKQETRDATVQVDDSQYKENGAQDIEGVTEPESDSLTMPTNLGTNEEIQGISKGNLINEEAGEEGVNNGRRLYRPSLLSVDMEVDSSEIVDEELDLHGIENGVAGVEEVFDAGSRMKKSVDKDVGRSDEDGNNTDEEDKNSGTRSDVHESQGKDGSDENEEENVTDSDAPKTSESQNASQENEENPEANENIEASENNSDANGEENNAEASVDSEANENHSEATEKKSGEGKMAEANVNNPEAKEVPQDTETSAGDDKQTQDGKYEDKEGNRDDNSITKNGGRKIDAGYMLHVSSEFDSSEMEENLEYM